MSYSVELRECAVGYVRGGGGLAEAAYRSKKNEAWLATNGMRSCLHRRKPPGRPMPRRTVLANAAKSRVRSAVEPVFARRKGPIALVVRTIGLARATTRIGLASLVCNMQHLVWLSARAALLDLPVELREHRIKRTRLGQLLARNSRIVLASGVGAPGSKPRKRNQLRRSRIRYSIRAAATLFCAASTRTSSIATGSYGGRPPLAPSP